MTGPVPFRHMLLVNRHEKAILFDLSRLVQLFYQEFDELCFALLGDYG